MFFEAALLVVTVQPGDTLSGIAATHGVSLSALEAANPQITNPDLIYAGNRVNLPGKHGYVGSHRGLDGDGDHDGDVSDATSPTHIPSGYTPRHQKSVTITSSGDLADVPGVPRSFAACVAMRESSNNPRAVNSIPGYIGNGGGAYGFLASTWHQLGYSGQPYNASVADQKAAFAKLYATSGTAPWSPSDGC